MQKPFSLKHAAACFIVTDIILALYPAFIIKNLYMPKRVKIGISFLLSLGLFAAACATVRTYEVHTAAESKDLTCKSMLG